MTIADITPDELRAFRSEMGWTQAELANHLGGSTRAVEDWEAVRRQPPAMLRLALAAIRRDLQPWSPSTFDHRYPEREAGSEMVRDHIEATLTDRALSMWEGWETETADMPLPLALILGFLSVGTDGYNDIKSVSMWKHLPQTGWQTSMVVKPELGNGLHPDIAFETRHDEYARRLAVFIDTKRPNERLPGRLRVERALVDEGFRVMTFSGEEVLADVSGCADRITYLLPDLVEETLVEAGHIQPRKRRASEIE